MLFLPGSIRELDLGNVWCHESNVSALGAGLMGPAPEFACPNEPGELREQSLPGVTGGPLTRALDCDLINFLYHYFYFCYHRHRYYFSIHVCVPVWWRNMVVGYALNHDAHKIFLLAALDSIVCGGCADYVYVTIKSQGAS